MTLVNDLISLPGLVDALIAFTLLEALLLATYRRITGKGVAFQDVGINLMSGLCLMLALRAGLRDQGPAWVCLWLLFAGIAHATDVVMRWPRKTTRADPATGPSQPRRKVAEPNIASHAEVHS